MLPEPRDALGEATDPQDRAVDRRSFLRRMATLAGAAVAGGAGSAVPVRSVVGTYGEGRLRLGPPREYEASLGGFLERARSDAGVSLQGDPAELTAWEALALIRDRELSPAELVEACLRRIERLDPVYSAFNEVLVGQATTRARALGAMEPTGLLHGIPLAIKDNFYTRGVRTTANSWIFQDFVPEYDATAVRRLAEAGGVVLGKTQMGPLATTRALTPDGEITTLNAWAPDAPSVSPGGSSSGSATAVAARLAVSSIGTQTGGSITQPSLAQGLTGLKPTMGRVSLHGVIPLSYTRDHPGPLARDARDAALLLQAMAGPDPMDPRTLGLPPVPDYLTAATPVVAGGRATLRWPTRIGVPPGWTDSDDATVAADRSRFLEALRDSGADVVELPPPGGWAELTSGSLNGARLPERSEIFLDVLKRDVRLFGVALAPWINGLLLSGEEYLKAQRAKLALLRLALDELFAECDVVVQTGTVPFDMIGLPLLALPVGLRQQGGRTLPHGVVLGGLPFGEERLLSVAAAWQAASDWHRVRPDDPVPSEEARSTGSPGIRRGRMGPEAVAALSQ